MKNNKSMKLNLIINICNMILSKIYPLITFPYITRVLLASGVGKYNFIVSFISYFQLIAGLGISTFAIREGSKIRDDKKRLEKFANEIFLFNIISTIVSYIFLFMILAIFTPLRKYVLYIAIYSIIIIFDTFGVAWIYSIYEDFFYITIRNFIVQVISLFFLFTFVKRPEHVLRYIILAACSLCISNLINGIHSRKYIKLFQFVKISSLKKYIRPVFTIFFAQIASVVYMNMDSIMLGIVVGDKSVGLYSASTKINSVLSALITSVSAVVLPRLSYYLEKEEILKFDNLIKKVLKYFIFLAVPCIIGLIPISYKVITWFCGLEFYQAGFTMRIMLLDLFWSLMNGFIAYQICIPYRDEKSVLMSTSAGAIVNTVFNVILIPMWHENGAAIATLFSEMIVFIILINRSKEMVNYKNIFNDIWQILIASVSFVPAYVILNFIKLNLFVQIIIYIIIGGIGYMLILKIMHNYIYNYIIFEIKKILLRFTIL